VFRDYEGILKALKAVTGSQVLERECCLLVLNSVTSTHQWITEWVLTSEHRAMSLDCMCLLLLQCRTYGLGLPISDVLCLLHCTMRASGSCYRKLMGMEGGQAHETTHD
jgi:hypothetical protein